MSEGAPTLQRSASFARALLRMRTADMNEWFSALYSAPSLSRTATRSSLDGVTGMGGAGAVAAGSSASGLLALADGAGVDGVDLDWLSSSALLDLPAAVGADLGAALLLQDDDVAVAAAAQAALDPAGLTAVGSFDAAAAAEAAAVAAAADAAGVDGPAAEAARDADPPGLLKIETSELTEGSGHRWYYSQDLRQIFAELDKVFPVPLRVNQAPPPDSYFRIYLEYIPDDMKHVPPKRCPTHHAGDADARLAPHILRVDAPAAQYECNASSGMCSIVVPWTAVDNYPASLALCCRLTCFSSCHGIGRRPIQLVVALETKNERLGQDAIEVRCCGAPVRDARRLERLAIANTLTNLKHSTSNGTTPSSSAKRGAASRGAAAAAPPAKKKDSIVAICRPGTSDRNDPTEYTVSVIGLNNYKVIRRLAQALGQHFHSASINTAAAAKPHRSLQNCTTVGDFLNCVIADPTRAAALATKFIATGYDDLELLEHLSVEDLANLGVTQEAEKQTLLAASRELAGRHRVRPGRHNLLINSDEPQVIRVTVERSLLPATE